MWSPKRVRLLEHIPFFIDKKERFQRTSIETQNSIEHHIFITFSTRKRHMFHMFLLSIGNLRGSISYPVQESSTLSSIRAFLAKAGPTSGPAGPAGPAGCDPEIVAVPEKEIPIPERSPGEAPERDAYTFHAVYVLCHVIIYTVYIYIYIYDIYIYNMYVCIYTQHFLVMFWVGSH